MTENSRDNDKTLSFKEQILRDLANSKGNRAVADLPAEVVEEASEVSVESLIEEELHSESTIELTESEILATFDESKVVRASENSEEIAHVGSELPDYLAVEEVVEEQEIPQPVVQSVPIKVNMSAGYKEANTHSLTESSTAKKEEASGSAKIEQATSFSRQGKMNKSQKKDKQNKVASRIVGTVVTLIVIGVIATGIFGYTYVNSALQPIDRNSTEYVTVEIPSGSGTKLIGETLEKAGLIKNATIFNYYSKFKNYANFQSGYYNLQKSMSLDDIAKKLQEGGTEEPEIPALAKIAIPEGYTLKQISEAVAQATKDTSKAITADEFMAKVQDETFIGQEVAKYPNLLSGLPGLDTGVKYRLEGYVFPATYNVTSETTVESLIDEMIAAMDTTMSSYYDQLAAKNLTVNEALTIASLVEKEGATDEDRKNIASVFYNRINQNMPLQSNIAILYAQDKLGQQTTLAEDAGIDTNIDSPYNIYKNTGLMPGPVDSPGLSAIEATVNPNKTNYLYFVANVDTGAVYFADTYEEHSKNVEEHVNSKLTQ